MKRTIIKCFVRMCVVCLYCYFGAISFAYMENREIPSNNETTSALYNLKHKYSCRLKNITDEVFVGLAEEILALTGKKKWSTEDGLQLTFEILTTIGYGSNPPKTDASRLFIIFYALVGIPLFLSFLQIVGAIINKIINKTICLVERKFIKSAEPQSIELKCMIGFSCSLVMYVFFIAFFLSAKYSLSYLTAVYLLFITFTTIGFGDYVIDKEKFFVVAVGLCLVSGLFDACSSYIEKKAEKARNKARKMSCCCVGKNTGASQEERAEHGMENKVASSNVEEL